jgi:hypothetical protein
MGDGSQQKTLTPCQKSETGQGRPFRTEDFHEKLLSPAHFQRKPHKEREQASRWKKKKPKKKAGAG